MSKDGNLMSAAGGWEIVLQFNPSVEAPAVLDDLELVVTTECSGQREGGSAGGDDGGVNHKAVLVKQAQDTAVTWRTKE